MNIIDGGVTAPKGFKAAGVRAGIKPSATKKDMAMIASTVPCSVAGTFTTNVVKAAPVKWDSMVVHSSGSASAVVVNSGIANACTGEEGYNWCAQTAAKAAELIDVSAENVLVASTGVIGAKMPMDVICEGIEKLVPALSESREAAHSAAEAILTTDTKTKEIAVQTEIGGTTVTVAGMCKGSGMICPNMATMLCFVTTDAAISGKMLQAALSENVQDTFNMISVDGDTSTNDSVLLLANGLAQNDPITAPGPGLDAFKEALNEVMVFLCKKIAGDGEGCTCLFEVRVTGAASKCDAKTLAKSVVKSSLTKAAIYGHDANWGRILCALGYSGVQFDPEKVDIWFSSKAGTIKIVENGISTGYSEEEATKILSEEEVTATADIHCGSYEATAWGCDLTYDYVKINADYRS